MNPGYWQSNYWVRNYWHEDYWQDSGGAGVSIVGFEFGFPILGGEA